MPRPIWKGHISFGLVMIPVTLSSAEAREETIDFDMLDRRDNKRIKYVRINEKTGEEVPWKDIVKGVEVGGKYVIVTPEDFKRAAPKVTRMIEIAGFIDRSLIAPKFYEKPYYLEPGEGGAKGYALLRDALRDSDRVGIAQIVMHTKQHLAALMTDGPALMLNTLRYDNELRTPSDFDNIPPSSASAKATRAELQMAGTLIEGMAIDWRPSEYKDEYHDLLRKWIRQRAKAGPHAPEPEVEEEVEAPATYSIMELLKQSLEQNRKALPAARKRTKSTHRRKAG
jgi:DNA end-binding protein Ku